MDESIIRINSVKGIDYVRPPTLDFLKIKETNDYTEFKIITKKNAKEKKKSKKGCPENPFTNYLDSFIFCKPTLNIKMPKKNYMIKDGKKKFAYAVGMFPNPKNGKPAYLDGCILAALGLKRQQTNADIICFITHDISQKDKEKLEVVFDKVIYVPYISPYDMGGEGDLKTIMIDKGLFDNCPNYTKQHPYVHVFFKLHIFNPDLFPYEKVCFVDSDLVPLNYYDSLFMLDCPAGFVEYRKKSPYLESYQWDRCDYLEHGKLIPKEITDIDKPSGADVNAGLLLIKPNKKEYNAMIKELSSPLNSWMGPNKKHKGFYSFNFDNPTGMEFVPNSYCYPEQNYLTKRYSGKWTFIEFAFQSWSRDPCNSFGIHMAAFNPKPWFKQPIGTLLKSDEKFQPYLKEWDKKNIRFPLAIKEDSNETYENISYSYEMFNEVIIWGMVNYQKLIDFFTHETQIHGTKVSFDRDIFKKLSPKENIQYKLLKDIKKGNKIYKKLSKSQKLITNLINDYDNNITKIKDNYLQICRDKIKDDFGNYDYNFKIINYPNHTTKPENDKNKLLKENKFPYGKFKGKQIKDLDKEYIKKVIQMNAYKKDPLLRKKIIKSHKKTIQSFKKGGGKTKKRTKKKEHTLHYFSTDWCGYCKSFNPQWNSLVEKLKNKKITLNKIIINDENQHLLTKFNIQSYPTLLLEKNNKKIFYNNDDRSIDKIISFLKKEKAF
tara:strand:+ start:728 stop:2875 length:2148 start_codon:yes stop_codon:yes gene_type:complete